MLSAYLKIAVRNLEKNLLYTSINVVGLALSIAAFVLIAEYVSLERSYNAFHSKLSSIHRVVLQKDGTDIQEYTAPGLAPIAAAKIVGIEQFCRIAEGANLGTGIVNFQTANNQSPTSFRENSFVYADGTFFEMFSFVVLEGNPQSLRRPNVVAISQSTSAKYFGKESAIGKEITLNNQFGRTLYVVELVYDDMPENSDLQYDLIFSLKTLENPANLNGNDMWASMDGTGSQWLYTYVSIKAGTSVVAVSDQYNKILESVNPGEKAIAILQPMSNMHLGESLNDPLPIYGSLRSVYIATGIAALILGIAWFNYINLSVASALKRGKEVGIRKANGASKAQIIAQFIFEAILVNAIACVVAVVILTLVQEPYAHFIGKKLSLNTLDTISWLFIVLVVFAGLFGSSAYTAFILSSMNPAKILKGELNKSTSGMFLRKSLVIFQYTVSMILITCAIVVFTQWNYMQSKDLGLDASQLLVVRGAEVNKDSTFSDRSASFERDLRSAPFVKTFSRSGNVPSDGFNFATTGITKLNPLEGSEKVGYHILTVDDTFFDTYSIDVVAGNSFTPEMCSRPWNEMQYMMLNESAAKSMGFTPVSEAINEKAKWGEREFIVQGIVKNYHHMSVHSAISPTIFLPSQEGVFYTLRLESKDTRTAVSSLEQYYTKSFAGNPFEYQFVDENFANRYTTEHDYGIIFTIASGIAILIASLGLFGLATYSIEQRTKEIGIRKVLGSTAAQIFRLFSTDFMILVSIAFVISVPVAWWAMNSWLQDFSYRIDIPIWSFATSGAVTLIIALFTIGSQAYKGALNNPVDSLRSE